MRARYVTTAIFSLHAAFIIGAELLWVWTDVANTHRDALGTAFVVFDLLASVITLSNARKLQGRERTSWMLLGSAIMVWSTTSIYFNTVLVPAGPVPVPSLADVGFLAFIPLAIGGLLFRLPPRLKERSAAQRIDGVAATLAAAALSAAIVMGPVLSHTDGRGLELLTVSAYPFSDALLLGMVVASLALNQWRVDRVSAMVAIGLAAFWIADSSYVMLQAQNAYNGVAATDVGWSICMLLFAISSRESVRRAGAARREPEPRQYADVTSPIAFALVGLGILVTAATMHLHPVAVVLAALSLTAMLVRLGLSLGENARLLTASRHEATTDALTGIGNRRALIRDLELAIAAGEPTTLVLFDLDGFKSYNDVFGHPAGDALLERLAHNLEARVAGGVGAAYRIGGDEFCALVHGLADTAQLDHFAEALSESGEGFQIGASLGAVQLPPEAKHAQDALKLVDQRMYACKNSNRASARAQSSEVLVRVLCERVPGMSRHLDAVRERATQTAIEMGVELSRIEHLRHAAMLHDIGCMSIPDAILSKPGPLSEEEVAFVREHPAAGSRILDAAPALKHLAPIVRAVQERFDGTGYPDGLQGEQIPLEARIIAVCDAYDTMVEDRPFRAAMSEEAALAELYAGSGTQFDPNVVDGFGHALLARHIVNRAA